MTSSSGSSTSTRWWRGPRGIFSPSSGATCMPVIDEVSRPRAFAPVAGSRCRVGMIVRLSSKRVWRRTVPLFEERQPLPNRRSIAEAAVVLHSHTDEYVRADETRPAKRGTLVSSHKPIDDCNDSGVSPGLELETGHRLTWERSTEQSAEVVRPRLVATSKGTGPRLGRDLLCVGRDTQLGASRHDRDRSGAPAGTHGRITSASMDASTTGLRPRTRSGSAMC
jgi:hypothetical protein